MACRQPGQPADPLFPTGRGRPLSRDAIERLIAKHAATAAHDCPTLASRHVSPHVLRPTCAMRRAGVDTSGIALWLGHESTRPTDIYLHTDLAPRTGHQRILGQTFRLQGSAEPSLLILRSRLYVGPVRRFE